MRDLEDVGFRLLLEQASHAQVDRTLTIDVEPGVRGFLDAVMNERELVVEIVRGAGPPVRAERMNQPDGQRPGQPRENLRRGAVQNAR
jgi:hypothetical protein